MFTALRFQETVPETCFQRTVVGTGAGNAWGHMGWAKRWRGSHPPAVSDTAPRLQPSQGHEREADAVLGLQETATRRPAARGLGRGRPEDAAAGYLHNTPTGWLLPSGTLRRGGQGLGHRLPHGTRFLRSSRHPSGIVRSAPPVAHSPAQGAQGAEGAADGAGVGAGADPRGACKAGAGPLRPGRLLGL